MLLTRSINTPLAYPAVCGIQREAVFFCKCSFLANFFLDLKVLRHRFIPCRFYLSVERDKNTTKRMKVHEYDIPRVLKKKRFDRWTDRQSNFERGF